MKLAQWQVTTSRFKKKRKVNADLGHVPIRGSDLEIDAVDDDGDDDVGFSLDVERERGAARSVAKPSRN